MLGSEPGLFAFDLADSELPGHSGFEAQCLAEPASGWAETVVFVAASVQVESLESDLLTLGLGHWVSFASAPEAGLAHHVAEPDLEPRKTLHHSEQFGVQMLLQWAVKEDVVELLVGSVAAEALKQQAAGVEGWVPDQEGLDLLPSELVFVQLSNLMVSLVLTTLASVDR